MGCGLPGSVRCLWLVHNRREFCAPCVSADGDGGLAVVDTDTLWQKREDGTTMHWLGRTGKVYTLTHGEWKLVMHTGVLSYDEPPVRT